MTIFLIGILRIVLLVGTGLLLTGYFGLQYIKRDHQPRLRRYLNTGMIVAAVFAGLLYLNLGYGRALDNAYASTAEKYVHYHEQFHFYFGSKYIKNVSYDNLYKATYLAAVDLRLAGGVKILRNLNDFGEYPAVRAEIERNDIVGRFSPAEWQNFKSDLATFLAARNINLQSFLLDHGNTGSPVWAIPAHLLTRFVTPGDGVLVVLALFDLLILGLIATLIGRSFGLVTGVVALVLMTCAPYVSDYLLGSFLRFDWLFATALGFYFAQQKRWSASGVAFAYAVLSKLFPIFFVIALGVKACWALYQKWQPLESAVDLTHYKKFFTGFALGLLGFFMLSAAYFGGTSLWSGYAARTEATLSEKFYLTNYSLRMPFLQVLDNGVVNTIEDRFVPPVVSMGKPDVSLATYATAWWVLLLTLGALYAWLIRRRTDIQALALGVPLIFFFLVVNPYYYGMLALFALYWLPEAGKRKASLVGMWALLTMLMCFYYFQHYSYYYYGGYLMSWLLTLVFFTLPIVELWRFWRDGGVETDGRTARGRIAALLERVRAR